MENTQLQLADNLDIEARLAHGLEVLRESKLFRFAPNVYSPLAAALRAHMLAEKKLMFIGYWGVGSRPHVGSQEIESLDFHRLCLDKISSAVKLPWQLDFVFTDTHAEINGKPSYVLEAYAFSVARLMKMQGFGFVRMRELLAELGALEAWQCACAGAFRSAAWQRLRPERRRELQRLAQKHAGQVRGEQAAATYLVSNLIEGAVIRSSRPNTIFLTFMAPSMHYLLPALPIVHIYSGPGEKVQRPWFSDEY